MAKKKRLTAKQLLFIDAYLANGGNGVQAARTTDQADPRRSQPGGGQERAPGTVQPIVPLQAAVRPYFQRDLSFR